MLTRIAGNSYWMARYLERAENDARLLAMAARHACLPEAGDDPIGLWSTALEVGGVLDAFRELGHTIDPTAVLRFMTSERGNSSSIVGCLRAARDNARTARHLLPDILWDTVNDAWIEAQSIDDERLATLGVDGVVGWTIARCRLIDGCCRDLWCDTVPHVIDLGRAIERADFIARILAEMLPALLAEGDAAVIPGSPRCRRWHSLLAGCGLTESWRRLRAGRLEPLAALYLILLHPTAPHSMLVSVRAMASAIRGFAPGREGEALATAREFQAWLIGTDLRVVVGDGMDGFCRQLTEMTNRLGAEVQRDHLT